MSGDRVRWFGDERVDLPDMDAVQELIYEAMARFFGGMWGIGSGCLTLPTIDASDPAGVSIGPCVLVGCSGEQADNWTLPELVVAVHDPSKSWQPASDIDLSMYQLGGGLPYLWFRLLEKESDEANRMAYDGVSESEEVVSENTRWRKYVLFGASISLNSTPDDSVDGWFPFAKVTSWNGAIPAIEILSAWDYGHVPVGAYAGSILALLAVGDSPEGTPQAAGAFHAIRALYLMVRKALDSTFTYNSATGQISNIGLDETSPTERGIEQLNADLTSLEDRFATVPVPLVWGYVRADGERDGGTPNQFNGLHKLGAAANDDERSAVGTYKVRCAGEVLSVSFAPRVVGSGARYSFGFTVTYPDAGDSLITVYAQDEGTTDLADASFFITAFGNPQT